MNTKAMISITVALAVGVILIGSLLIPVLNGAQEDMNPTYDNTKDGYLKMAMVDTATIAKESGTITINDEVITLTTAANAIVFTDSFVINARTTNFYVITGTTATNLNDAAEFHATIGNGTVTYQIGTNAEVTISYTGPVFVASSNGEYTNASGGTIYTNDLDKVYGWAWANNKLYTSAGDVTTIAGTPGAVTDLAETKDNAYDSLYSMTFSSVELDSEGTPVSPVTLIVPVSFSVHLNGTGDGMILILAAIPIVVIILLLITAVKMIGDRD